MGARGHGDFYRIVEMWEERIAQELGCVKTLGEHY